MLFVFVGLGHHRRRAIHFNVTAHPTAEWTARQIAEAARVLVKTYKGQVYTFQFDLVEWIKSFEPEGLMLYSLIEMSAPVRLRTSHHSAP